MEEENTQLEMGFWEKVQEKDAIKLCLEPVA